MIPIVKSVKPTKDHLDCCDEIMAKLRPQIISFLGANDGRFQSESELIMCVLAGLSNLLVEGVCAFLGDAGVDLSDKVGLFEKLHNTCVETINREIASKHFTPNN